MKLDTLKLRSAMIQRGIKQRDLAQETNISYSMINAICCGRACGFETAQKIAGALDMKLEDLDALKEG